MSHVESAPTNGKKSGLDSAIAIAVAIAATLIAVFNIKDNNIVQAMSQAQAHAVDAWSYYQSKGTKEHLAENSKLLLETNVMIFGNVKGKTQEKINSEIKKYDELIQKYEREKAEIKSQAEGFENEYNSLNVHDDQFDLAEALLSLALSLFGITALIQNKKLFYFAATLSGLGLFFGLAGFLNWNIHPDIIARILG